MKRKVKLQVEKQRLLYSVTASFNQLFHIPIKANTLEGGLPVKYVAIFVCILFCIASFVAAILVFVGMISGFLRISATTGWIIIGVAGFASLSFMVTAAGISDYNWSDDENKKDD